MHVPERQGHRFDRRESVTLLPTDKYDSSLSTMQRSGFALGQKITALYNDAPHFQNNRNSILPPSRLMDSYLVL